MKTSYLHLPTRMWYCKATEDCCYEIVSYDPNWPVISNKLDKDSDDLDSGILACACHPSLEIIPVNQEEYEKKYAEVMEMQQKRA